MPPPCTVIRWRRAPPARGEFRERAIARHLLRVEVAEPHDLEDGEDQASRDAEAERLAADEQLRSLSTCHAPAPARMKAPVTSAAVITWKYRGSAVHVPSPGLVEGGLDLRFADGALERGVIPLRLVGVGEGEGRERLVERVALAQVPADARGFPRAR